MKKIQTFVFSMVILAGLNPLFSNDHYVFKVPGASFDTVEFEAFANSFGGILHRVLSPNEAVIIMDDLTAQEVLNNETLTMSSIISRPETSTTGCANPSNSTTVNFGQSVCVKRNGGNIVDVVFLVGECPQFYDAEEVNANNACEMAGWLTSDPGPCAENCSDNGTSTSTDQTPTGCKFTITRSCGAF